MIFEQIAVLALFLAVASAQYYSEPAYKTPEYNVSLIYQF